MTKNRKIDRNLGRCQQYMPKSASLLCYIGRIPEKMERGVRSGRTKTKSVRDTTKEYSTDWH